MFYSCDNSVVLQDSMDIVHCHIPILSNCHQVIRTRPSQTNHFPTFKLKHKREGLSEEGGQKVPFSYWYRSDKIPRQTVDIETSSHSTLWNSLWNNGYGLSMVKHYLLVN